MKQKILKENIDLLENWEIKAIWTYKEQYLFEPLSVATYIYERVLRQ